MARKKTSDIIPQRKQNIYPVLMSDDIVVLPGLPQPVKIEDEKREKFIHKAFSQNKIILAGWLKEIPEEKEIRLMRYGMLCKIDKVLQLPGSPTLAFLIPLQRVSVIKLLDDENAPFPEVEVNIEPEVHFPTRRSKLTKSMEEGMNTEFAHLLNFMPEPERKNAEIMVENSGFNHLDRLYAMAHVAPITNEERYDILLCDNYASLVETCLTIFDQASQRINIQAAIHERTHRELSRQQKEAFLRMHMKHIKEEIGESGEEEDIQQLIFKSEKIKWSEDAKKHFTKELGKLKRLNVSNPEYSVQYSYLETLLELPWDNYAKSKISLKKVEEILDRQHYGLEKVKDRILEHMAVLSLRDDLKSPIICLYGPPGVGKTSIGRSIAEAMGREYVRISLGGIHDEAEIRGHRRTYIGAMPGRFLQSLSKCKTGNPLILLDEIDKVGKDYKGDPSSALLEALDPEQNNTFHDNFIDFPYNLSNILFIATANDISTIPAPLRDRMELIEMSGYIPAEKREIALRHLVAKELQNNGFGKEEITFTPEAIDHIIRFYTREAGVRQLEKKLGMVLRKIARLKASKKSYPKVITPQLAADLLGKQEVFPYSYENNDFAGVATGLAWTPMGGDILSIETSLSLGKGEKLALTGNLGDVMKESAVIACQYLKSHAAELGICHDIFNKVDIHIHVPEGAVPKDGPSAGITLAVSMASAFTGKKLKERTAMTGELTLRGKVLPVGGIKEKIIAAKGAGISRIILSEENRRDVEEIAPQYLEGLEFIYVKTLNDVFEEALSNDLALYRFELPE